MSAATAVRSLEVDDTVARAVETLAHLQTWPGHFRRRALEMEAVSRVYDFSSAKRTLELGCGNAFASALIADGRERLVVTDLYRESVDTHSVDLGKARQLLDGLGLHACDVVAASGQSLPFAAGTFDLVFSLFVLEHVPDRAACLREIRRVLGRDGVTVHAVPGVMWAIAAPFRFPFYLIRRVLARVVARRPRSAGKHQQAQAGQAADGGEALEKMTWALFRQRYPAFPIPPPHGSYRNYPGELQAYRRSSWVALLEEHGFEVTVCAPLTILSPDVLLRAPATTVGKWLMACDRWLSSRRWLRVFGQFFVIIAKPRADDTPCR